MTRRAVVLVDGEHYPPVIRAGIDDLTRAGMLVVAAVFLGGTEKVAGHGADVDLGVPVTWVPPGDGPGLSLVAAAMTVRQVLGQHEADVVVDLSDEPVLDARRRLQLAAHVLHAGVVYEAADARLTPPARPRIAACPSIAVIGTGKRTGKTAIAGEITRRLVGLGSRPVVVAMGRGGPAAPVVVPAGSITGPEDLLAVADAGGHAASDFYEDALTTGVATVGARRCGGGLAGAVAHSNVAEAVVAANALAPEILVLEGSGSAIPPVRADAGVLVVPADCDPELVVGYLGAYRVLLADLVVVTMALPPRGSPRRVATILEAIRSISQDTPVLTTTFRPFPLAEVAGERICFATTAPTAARAAQAAWLEQRYDCEVVAASSHLADRPRLQAELAAAPAFDVLLVECKAAAVDVAARIAAQVGARVVFCDNRPQVVAGTNGVNGDPEPHTDDGVVQDAVARLRHLAAERF